MIVVLLMLLRPVRLLRVWISEGVTRGLLVGKLLVGGLGVLMFVLDLPNRMRLQLQSAGNNINDKYNILLCNTITIQLLYCIIVII